MGNKALLMSGIKEVKGIIKVIGINIEASILSHNNRQGLNAVLWSIFGQTCLPGLITICNTGLPNLGSQVFETLSILSLFTEVKIVSVRNYCDNGNVDFGKTRKGQFDTFTKDFIWYLEDDFYISPLCLQTQRETHSPSLPLGIDFSYSVPKSEVAMRHYEDGRVVSSGIWGLLAERKALQAIPLQDWKYLDDEFVCNSLSPLRVSDVYIIHGKQQCLDNDYLFEHIAKLWRGYHA